MSLLERNSATDSHGAYYHNNICKIYLNYAINGYNHTYSSLIREIIVPGTSDSQNWTRRIIIHIKFFLDHVSDGVDLSTDVGHYTEKWSHGSVVYTL